MKGLLIKDFKLSLKAGFLYYGLSILVIVCEIINIFNDNNFAKGMAISSVIMSTIVLSYIAPLIMYADEKYGWDKYEKILPISKKIIVAEKYILPYLIIIVYSIINTIIIWVYNDCRFNLYALGSVLSDFVKSLFIGMIIPVFSIPLCIKFGYLKSKYIKLAIILLAIIALYSNLSDYIIGNNISELVTKSIDGLLNGTYEYEIQRLISLAINIAAIIVINAISYLISLAFYKSDKN